MGGLRPFNLFAPNSILFVSSLFGGAQLMGKLSSQAVSACLYMPSQCATMRLVKRQQHGMAPPLPVARRGKGLSGACFTFLEMVSRTFPPALSP